MIASLAYTLIGINLLAYCMVVLRPRLYKTKLYRPMLLNIKLSVIPIIVLMAVVTVIVVLQAANTYLENQAVLGWVCVAVAVLGFAVWLLLLPNSGYLITELNFNHREKDGAEVPLWYDIVGVLALAMSGVMNMCFNVFAIQFVVALFFLVLDRNVSFLFGLTSWVVMGLLMVLASFGIYLGRYIRVNSWDVKHPVQFLHKLRNHYKGEGTVRNCALFVLFHTLFFIVFYRATVGVVLEELVASISV